jgi:hypothetical protein
MDTNTNDAPNIFHECTVFPSQVATHNPKPMKHDNMNDTTSHADAEAATHTRVMDDLTRAILHVAALQRQRIAEQRERDAQVNHAALLSRFGYDKDTTEATPREVDGTVTCRDCLDRVDATYARDHDYRCAACAQREAREEERQAELDAYIEAQRQARQWESDWGCEAVMTRGEEDVV